MFPLSFFKFMESDRKKFISRFFFFIYSMRGTDNGAFNRRRDSGWRSKSLTIAQSVKVLV